MDKKKVKVTHAIMTQVSESKDAISKSLLVLISNDGSSQLIFETIWEEGEDPVKTVVTLSAETLYLLQETITEIQMNRNKYVVIDDSD